MKLKIEIGQSGKNVLFVLDKLLRFIVPLEIGRQLCTRHLIYYSLGVPMVPHQEQIL